LQKIINGCLTLLRTGKAPVTSRELFVWRGLQVCYMPREFKKNGFFDLLATLKRNHFLSDYNLTMYRIPEEDNAMSSIIQCGSNAHNPFINETIAPFLINHILDVMKNRRPVIRRLSGGLLCFLIPVRIGGGNFCLVGEGVREKCINVTELEDFCKTGKSDVFEMIEKIEALPVRMVKDVEQVANKLQKIFGNLSDDKNHVARIINTRNKIASILQKMARIDKMETSSEVVSLSGEILRDLFGCTSIAIVLRNENKGGFSVIGIKGLNGGTWGFPESKLSFFLNPGSKTKSIKLDKEGAELFHLPGACKATCFPLETQRVVIGFIAVFDHCPDRLDDQLTKFLADRITVKLHMIKNEVEQAVVGSLSHSLLSLTNILLFAESKEELYRNILEISADLVRASRGSIMLVDNNGKNLRIAFCKGMNWYVARSITVRMGEGIAGRVAKSGIPLLVEDVEKDYRVRMANRPRFRTKALLCVPLKLKEKTIGVLNLSDKENMEVFKESDLDMLASFANLASLMIERAWTLERSSMLEKLSVTDYLTGLYNHRFLRNRLEEELCRSIRNKTSVTVIFIDLDFFKTYNDLSGHLAGDVALKKTADILTASVRDMDIVVRYGGEEFCIVLPDTSKEEAEFVAERIRSEIENEKFINEENMPFGCLTASFGIATFPGDGHTYTTLIHSADLALYSAKTGGRNKVVLGRPVMPNGENTHAVPTTGEATQPPV
jgi:diguanylate cyclase (GGDEF)-like protein